MPDSVQVPFSRHLPVRRSQLVFRALHVHVRINELGLDIYYCALWAVSWEPNLLSALVHSLIGHRVPFKGWRSACSALPRPCGGQPSSLQSLPSMSVWDLECLVLLGCKLRFDLVVVWRGQFQQHIQTNGHRWNCSGAALCKNRL